MVEVQNDNNPSDMLTKVVSLAKFKKCLDLARIRNFLFAWGGEKVSAGCLTQGGELLV